MIIVINGDNLMKQHITIEQLNELSNKARYILDVWCDSRNIVNSKFECTECGRDSLLTIGQLIEFLEHHGSLGNILHLLHWTGAVCSWRVTNKNGIPANIKGNQDFIELCDALWSACVEVLNKEMK
jgi:hypothetical protein